MDLDNFITPPLLYDLLCSSERVLVLDVRKKADFLCERIWSSIHLDLETFPSISAIAKNLYHTPKLNDSNCAITPYTHHKLFTNWELYRIVVVDENGSAHALVQQFKHTTNKHLSTQLLVGGYKTFKALYSDLCQGSTGEDQFLIDKCLKKWNENYPLEVLPHLFCGDTEVATNYRALDVLGIECMVNVAVFVDNHAPYAYTYLRCDQDEIPSGDLEDLFNRVFKFIEIAKKGNKKVLIYSATDRDGLAGMFACAYLMHFNDWSLESSFLYFKSKCRSFSPNVAILARLGDYETTLVGTKFIEENMKHSEDDGGGEEEDKVDQSKLSDELKYVRRQQVHKLEEEIAEQAAMGDDDEEEDLC